MADLSVLAFSSIVGAIARRNFAETNCRNEGHHSRFVLIFFSASVNSNMLLNRNCMTNIAISADN